MSIWRTELGHPGWGMRTFLGIFGSAVPLAGPFIVKFLTLEEQARLGGAVESGPLTILVLIILAWVVSVGVTIYNKDDHVLSTLMGSMGFPSVVVSFAVGIQAVQ